MKGNENTVLQIKTGQVVLTATIWAQVFLVIYLVTCTLVPGFGFYDADPPAPFHAISHVGFWAAIEIFVVFVGAMSLYFDIGCKKDGLVLAFERTREWLTFWFILLFVAIAANIIHIVAAGLELSDCRSSLCLNYSGFLVALIVLLSLIVALEVLQLYNIHVYKKRLNDSLRIVLRAQKDK